MYRLFDLYAGRPPRDWSKELLTLFSPPAASGAATATPAARPAAAAPTLPLEAYAGSYVDSTYGGVEVSLAEGALRAHFGREELGGLEPWNYDTFRAVGPPPARSRTVMTFLTDGAGRVTAVRVFGVVFNRARPAR
jgi:hypothetical protein